MNNEVLSRYLPKWPQMIVTGSKLSPEQAMEIIRRTDSFFTWHLGNDAHFIEKADELVRYPARGDMNAIYQFEKTWGVVCTNYVDNDWISCSYIYGPNGWCHPDGTIEFQENIGKWPTGEEVFHDWQILAREFPFIEVECTIMDDSYSEERKNPVMSFLVRNGTVEIVDPMKRDIHKEFNRTIGNHTQSFSFSLEGEHAISMDQIKKWSEEVYHD